MKLCDGSFFPCCDIHASVTDYQKKKVARGTWLYALIVDGLLIRLNRVSSEGVLPVFDLTIESQTMCEC